MGCGYSDAVADPSDQEHFDIYIQLLSPDDFEVENLLAEGCLSVVYSARIKHSGENVALKFYGYQSYYPDFDSIKHELELMSLAKQVDGVVQTLGYFIDTQEGLLPNKKHRSRYPVIVMEKLEGGELFELVQAHEKITEYHVADIFRAVVTAVVGLHQLRLLHRE